MANDNTIGKLVEIFSRLPGVGPKQAKRFVYHLLAQSQGSLDHLARLVSELKHNIHQCERCTRFFTASEKTSALCDLCGNQTRDNGTLMIVEKDIDLNNINQLEVYNGQYAVLGNLIPILEPAPEQRIRQRALLNNIDFRVKNHQLKEIIIAISATREGDNTVDYLKKLCRPYEEKGVKISILGRGLSSGTEIEYTDFDTIKNALINRH